MWTLFKKKPNHTKTSKMLKASNVTSFILSFTLTLSVGWVSQFHQGPPATKRRHFVCVWNKCFQPFLSNLQGRCPHKLLAVSPFPTLWVYVEMKYIAQKNGHVEKFPFIIFLPIQNVIVPRGTIMWNLIYLKSVQSLIKLVQMVKSAF